MACCPLSLSHYLNQCPFYETLYRYYFKKPMSMYFFVEKLLILIIEVHLKNTSSICNTIQRMGQPLVIQQSKHAPELTRLPWTKWPPFFRWYFQMHFHNEKICILIRISLKNVPKGPIDNNPELSPAWCQAIIWTHADTIHWCLYVALVGDELIKLLKMCNKCQSWEISLLCP